MKQFIKALPIVLLTVMGSAMAANTVGRTFFLGNSGRTISNGLIVNAGRTHMPDQDAFNGVFSVQQHYSQNFNEADIGKYLFFNGTNSMTVRGAINAAATPTDIFSPNLLIGGTTTVFNSTITVNPSVSSATTDLRLNVGLDEFMQGLHFNVSLPIVWTKFDAKLTEAPITANGTFATGWLDVATATPASTYTNAIAAFRGNLTQLEATETMKFGKIDGPRSETAVGNVVVELGYDFICKENAHLSVGIHGLFNGAAKSDAVYLFEPSIGTAGRHGVGGTVTGHVRLYEGESDDMNFTLHGSAQVTGVFDSVQRRSYDAIVKHGVGSRYLMVKTGTVAVHAVATSDMANLINYSTLNAKIGLGALYDINLMVRYQNGGLCCDLGYTAWGHSAESHKSWVDEFASGKFVGAMVLGTADWANNIANISQNVTIKGTQADGTTAATGVASSATTSLSRADLDTNSGLNPAAMTNSVFGNVGYEWMDSDWKPFIGAGAAGEFANDNNAFDQWHVFVNGGVSF